MILVRLMGGMGNQMFQYAMARTLAHRYNYRLLIDKSLCAETERLTSSGLTLRAYGLDVFNVYGQVVKDESCRRTLKVRKENRFGRTAAFLFCRVANNFSNCWGVLIYERKNVAFDKSLLNLPDNVTLQGYFPSYKYFRGTEDFIRRDFTFNVEPDERNQKIIELISSSNSISVHLRRGDYISNKKTREKFGLCNLTYYEKAVKYFAKMVKEPRFFIFTNDPDYAEDNLKINYPTKYVTHNSGRKSFEDMRLMSLCKHNIITNSSFSWWGAWLNRNPDKIVIAPSPAFDKVTLRDSDFYPELWILLDKS
jgi:hypothetical protein